MLLNMASPRIESPLSPPPTIPAPPLPDGVAVAAAEPQPISRVGLTGSSAGSVHLEADAATRRSRAPRNVSGIDKVG
jgi:hypothetical protein